jgi:hypothetical protein
MVDPDMTNDGLTLRCDGCGQTRSVDPTGATGPLVRQIREFAEQHEACSETLTVVPGKQPAEVPRQALPAPDDVAPAT